MIHQGFCPEPHHAAGARPESAPAEHPVLALQRRIGNRATAALVQRRRLSRMTYSEYVSLKAEERGRVDAAIDFALRVGFGSGPSIDDRATFLAWVLRSSERSRLVRIGEIFEGYGTSERTADPRWAREEALLVRKGVEAFLRSSPLVPNHVKQQLGGGGARSALEGKFRIHGREAFSCAAAREQHRRVPELPDEGLFRAIAAWNAIAGTAAFGTRLEGEGVALRAGMADLHNGVHEALHVFCGPGWHSTEWPSDDDLAALRENLQEGVTEYLTREIAGGGGYYDAEVRFVGRILADKGVTTEELAALYFGDVRAFLRRVGLMAPEPTPSPAPAAEETTAEEDLDALLGSLAAEKGRRPVV